MFYENVNIIGKDKDKNHEINYIFGEIKLRCCSLSEESSNYT